MQLAVGSVAWQRSVATIHTAAAIGAAIRHTAAAAARPLALARSGPVPAARRSPFSTVDPLPSAHREQDIRQQRVPNQTPHAEADGVDAESESASASGASHPPPPPPPVIDHASVAANVATATTDSDVAATITDSDVTAVAPSAAASASAAAAAARSASQLDRSIQRQLFSSKAQMRARGVLERMQRMRSRVVLLGRAHDTTANGSASDAAASAAAQAGAPASPVPRAHPHATAPALSLEEAVQSVFHRSLVSRLSVRMGPSRSRTVLLRWRRIVARLLGLGGSSTGNSVQLYADGTGAWAAMWAAIEGAHRTIHLETYTLEPDGVGIKTMRLLAAAARRGVQVHLCYDSFGSSNLIHTRADIDDLIDAGAHVVHFNPIWHIFLREAWRGSLWFRNHRKILIVDGKVGFCGGMNVSSDYYGKQVEQTAATVGDGGSAAAGESTAAGAAQAETEFVGGTGKFRDTHLRVEGPAVQHLERVSRDTFQEAAHVLQAEWAAKARSDAERDELEERRRRSPRWYPARSAALVQAMADRERDRDRDHDRDREAGALLREQAEGEDEDPALVALREQLSCPVPPHASSSGSGSGSSSGSGPVEAHDLFVQVLPSNVWRNMRLIQRAMLLTIQQAKHRICITNPYFIPPPSMMRALQSAASRGVQVQIVMAGDADVPITRWASQQVYHSLLIRGVEIYELQAQVLHAKTVTIDGIYSCIGSFNWDRLSDRRNLEVNITVLDPCLAQQMEAQFEADLAKSKPVTIQSLKKRNMAQRLLHRLCYWFLRGL